MRVRVLLSSLAAAALALLPAGGGFAATYQPGVWNVSGATYYGPGLYGNRTACGQTLRPDLQGVAHRSLPCGTLVELEWHGRHTVVPVVDRGPFGGDAEWDLTEATCRALSVPGDDRCITHEIAWRL